MTQPPYPDSPIDKYSEYSLYDVISGEMPGSGISTEYLGLHITGQTKGRYLVQPDGHIGHLSTVRSEDFDDVLELVDHLNGLALEWFNHQEHGTKEELVEFAGRIMTSDEVKAERQPEIYIHIPDDPLGAGEAA